MNVINSRMDITIRSVCAFSKNLPLAQFHSYSGIELGVPEMGKGCVHWPKWQQYILVDRFNITGAGVSCLSVHQQKKGFCDGD